MVLQGQPRWAGWIQAFECGDETLLPALLPEQRGCLLDLARFLCALCRPGSDGVELGEWPFFWVVLMDGFPPPEYLRRGEMHLQRVVQWLRERYPVSTFESCLRIQVYILMQSLPSTCTKQRDDLETANVNLSWLPYLVMPTIEIKGQ